MDDTQNLIQHMLQEGTRALLKQIIIYITITILLGCASGMRVHRVPDKGPPSIDGRYLIYSLPKATIILDIPITRTVRDRALCATKEVLDKPLAIPPAAPTRTAPPAAATASDKEQDKSQARPTPKVENVATVRDRLKDLGIEPADAPISKIEIGEVVIGTRMESDPRQVFAIRLNSSVLDSKKFGLELNEEGVLGSASLESSNKITDIVVKAITTTASVISGALMKTGTVAPVDHCRLVLRRIEELRAKREALVTGSASTNGTPKDALDLMLVELRGLEDAYVAEFSGPKTVQKATARCEWSPNDNTTDVEVKDKQDLFSFSNVQVSKADACVIPEILKIPFKLDSGIAPKEGEPKAVSLSLKGNASLARSAARYEPASTKEPGTKEPGTKEPGTKESGLYFRVPVRVTASLYVGKEERLRSRMDIPQYGAVVSLPGDSDVKSASIAVTTKFGPSGSLISLSHSVAPVDVGAVIDATGTATKSTLDAVKARRNSDVEALEREKKRLELIRDIKKLEAGEELEE